MNHTVSTDQLKSLILNAHKVKENNRCEQCLGTGYENWNENGEDIRHGQTSDPSRANGVCQICDGIGYRDIFMYKEQEA
jgi:hypothetical protein